MNLSNISAASLNVMQCRCLERAEVATGDERARLLDKARELGNELARRRGWVGNER